MKCKACGRAGLRKTVTVWILDASDVDRLSRGRVCQTCASNGATIVPIVRPKIVSSTKAVKLAASAVLAPYVAALESQAKARRAQVDQADKLAAGDDVERLELVAETLENAVALLKSGRFEPSSEPEGVRPE